jgi:2-oxoglutarate/2-oxoacid ferredoxin oxidoreductase subunit alpha
LVLLMFGSSSGPVREAVQRAAAQGVDVRLIVLRLLAPLQEQAFANALQGVEHVMVVEQNHGAQLQHYLRGWVDLPRRPASFHRPGPLPLRPAEVCAAVVEWAKSLQVQEEMA